MAHTNDRSPIESSGWQLLLENCPYPLALCDADGRIAYASRSLSAQAGKPAGLMAGLPVQTALSGQSEPQLMGQVSETLWMYSWLRPVAAPCIDQTTQENRVFRLALEQVGLYVFEYRIDRDELHLLAPVSSVFTETQTWRGGPELISEYIHATEEDALFLADAFANAAYGRSASLDLESHINAETNWLRVTLSPILRDARMTGTVIGTIWNITSQKLAEQRATRDTAFRNNILAGISSGWELTLEQNHWTHLWNGEPALVKLTQDQLFYDDYDHFFQTTFRSLVHPDDWDNCIATLERGALLARFRRGQNTCSAEYRIRSRMSADAPYEWRSVTVRLSRDPATLQPKASGHVTDISPQKANELEAQRERLVMEQTARNERRSNARKSQFIADTARALQAPLQAMVGVSELALLEEMSDIARDFLQQIHDFGGDLLHFLGDALALASTGSQSGISTKEEYSPLALLEHVAEIARQNSDTTSTLSIRLDGAVPARLYGDSMRLRQALLCLVGPALAVSPAVELVISCATQDAETAMLCATLTDRHTTLTEDQLMNLFVAFSNSYYGGSTGLGLSTARQLARLMDGELNAAALPDGGTRLNLTVPQRIIDPRPIDVA